MISQLEIIDNVYQVVAGTQLKEALTGLVYKVQRPDNSTKEDAVINALPVMDGTPDLCFVNLNIYVPDLQATIENKQQQVPDYERMQYLTDLAMNELKEYYGGTFSFYCYWNNIEREEQIKYHFVNLRLEYRSFN